MYVGILICAYGGQERTTKLEFDGRLKFDTSHVHTHTDAHSYAPCTHAHAHTHRCSCKCDSKWFAQESPVVPMLMHMLVRTV